MSMKKIIKTHKELAQLITNKRILHLNSLGKDSVLCLEWLTRSCRVEKIISLHLGFMAKHPDDDRYLAYLKKRFPQVEFLVVDNTTELSLIADGVYQSPIDVTHDRNHWEYIEFVRGEVIREVKEKYQCDYACDGASKYEDFSRRTKFHQKGLEFKGVIYPLGMMSKAEVYGLIKATGIKLHPMYKFTDSTYDHPSYWKMRAGIIANDQYYKNLLNIYPLFVLDKYRYEVLLKGRIK